jgi:hypothetical protein
MASKNFLYILGFGVVAGIGGGVLLGGYKIRQELIYRNRSRSPTSFDEAGKKENQENVEVEACPWSANFDRIVEEEQKRNMSKRTIASLVV